MTDKTDLIEQMREYDEEWTGIASPRKDYYEGFIQLCIESDEAREYWQEQLYDIQQRAVQLAVMLEKQHFIEQACEAVDSLPSSCGINLVCKDSVEQVIRDKFK